MNGDEEAKRAFLADPIGWAARSIGGPPAPASEADMPFWCWSCNRVEPDLAACVRCPECNHVAVDRGQRSCPQCVHDY